MATPVKLRDIIDALDMMFEGWSAYLDKRTGEVHSVSGEAFAAAEDDESSGYHDAEEEDIERARDILEHDDNYVRLPTEFERDDYRTMEEFCRSREDEKISNELSIAIRGRGAFRCFKDTIHRLDITKDWYAFRDAATKELAIEWCEENELPYTDEEE